RLLLGTARLAVLLHDVHSLDHDASRLGVHADDLPFLALVVAAHHANGVALHDVNLLALGVDLVPRAILLAAGLSVRQDAHVTGPPAPARRSSCTSFRAAHGRPVRKCGSPWARPLR